MRVLNVNASLDPVQGGGTVERTVQMSRYLAKSGADCEILTTDVGLTSSDAYRLEKVEIEACPCLWARFFVPKGCLKRIEACVGRADIVHLMGHWSILNVLAYIFIRRFRKAYVVCPAGSLPIYGRSKLLKHTYNALLGNRIMREADAVIAVTEGDRVTMHNYGVAPEKVIVIPNGVELTNSRSDGGDDFRRKFHLGDSRIVLFMGRLNHIKGPDLLLQAFCNLCDEFPEHILVYAGPDGGMLAEMRDYLATRSSTDRVKFVGYLGGEDKAQAYRAADLLVIPSRQEPMSIVVLEAGREGTPVMVTNHCDFDVIEEVGGGIVVDATAKGIEQGLRSVLGRPKSLKDMGEKFRGYVEETFGWEQIVRKYVDLYEGILEVH